MSRRALALVGVAVAVATLAAGLGHAAPLPVQSAETATYRVPRVVAPPAITLDFVADRNGKAEKNDVIQLRFPKALDPSTVCGTWTSTSTPDLTHSGSNALRVSLTNSGANDSLGVAYSPCGTFRYGTIALGGDFVTTTVTFSGTNSGQTSTLSISADRRTLTLTLGQPSGSNNDRTTVGSPVTATWAPPTGLKYGDGSDVTSNASYTGVAF